MKIHDMVVKMLKSILNPPSQSFFLIGPRGAGKSTWMRTEDGIDVIPFGHFAGLLAENRRYIAANNPTAAKRWVDRLRTRARNALLAPLAGRKMPELLRDDIRELIEGNYRNVYQVFEDRLVIQLTVFEGHHLFSREKVDSSV